MAGEVVERGGVFGAQRFGGGKTICQKSFPSGRGPEAVKHLQRGRNSAVGIVRMQLKPAIGEGEIGGVCLDPHVEQAAIVRFAHVPESGDGAQHFAGFAWRAVQADPTKFGDLDQRAEARRIAGHELGVAEGSGAARSRRTAPGLQRRLCSAASEQPVKRRKYARAVVELYLKAIFASGDRTAKLGEVAVPALVIHGRDDTLITPSGGFRTAEVIPGAHLLFVSDMGHDMPEPLWPMLTDAIISHTRSA